MSLKDRRLAELRSRIPEIPAAAAHARQREGSLLVDVREDEETAAGSPAGALRLPRGFLELRIEDKAPDTARPILLICAGGTRSLFAAEDLKRLGYQDVGSVEGGFSAWKAAGLPVEVPPALDASQRERYRRHLTMPEVGERGQHRLLQSRVALIGAGGLGSPVAMYLAAAGVGRLTLIDDDRVERSNLQRQILHAESRLGQRKVESGRTALLDLNPTIEVVAQDARIEAANVLDLLGGHDVVVDGSDNLPTRYLVNDACLRLGVPVVYGAIFRFEGQVSVFGGGPAAQRPCYRCLFPEPPPAEYAPSCAEAGVLGVLPGVIGTIMAAETVKLLLGLGQPLAGRLLLYDGLRGEFNEIAVPVDPDCASCSGRAGPELRDLAAVCGA
ncbi:molybdopterin-synthase adenylyltransferase MoeB [Azospirillum picis]|uniref:Molybdopterin/thiamine biosynthesis adenylyltransferase/rhodanese-related sulfurtransferase n=1 Tax=Azospirillum picis TaxID=488438 RepID=A0ABU0MIG3_9PROT|nr:molybdopterin-synthase adenylyltransferase MoeB [Azospirillum picis]MBP2299666.1 molybdopterin/thiamine biosynthesis adenylyltransferase/rhodanese-related sulfurtransferase [Azospirillum picis]MDQ0533207.1 molybdopterin/thiamine biosynthesis adenylyltransferase/rhodanese-related sulfurtransferase [Azospirillum picis]